MSADGVIVVGAGPVGPCSELREMIAEPVAFRDRLAFPAKLRSHGAPAIREA